MTGEIKIYKCNVCGFELNVIYNIIEGKTWATIYRKSTKKIEEVNLLEPKKYDLEDKSNILLLIKEDINEVNCPKCKSRDWRLRGKGHTD